MGLRIKKGDKVEVIAGKNKGKTGKILTVDTIKGRAVVEGVNLVKKHMRRRSESEPGGIKEVPAFIHISNLNLFCSHCNKGARFGVNLSADKNKSRICRRCKQPI